MMTAVELAGRQGHGDKAAFSSQEKNPRASRTPSPGCTASRNGTRTLDGLLGTSRQSPSNDAGILAARSTRRRVCRRQHSTQCRHGVAGAGGLLLLR